MVTKLWGRRGRGNDVRHPIFQSDRRSHWVTSIIACVHFILINEPYKIAMHILIQSVGLNYSFLNHPSLLYKYENSGGLKAESSKTVKMLFRALEI